MGRKEIDLKTEELMWLEIDETISPGARESLYAHLERDPDAREHFEELRRMALLFGQVGEVDPPAALRERILRALEGAAPPAAARAGVLDRLGAFFAPRPALRLAAAAAAGVIVGVVGYHLYRHGPGAQGSGDVAHFYGAIHVNGLGHNGAPLRIEVPGVSATVTVRRNRSQVISQLDVASEAEIEVVIGYGGPPLGFAGGELSGHPSNQVAIQDGGVRVRHRGSASYRFVFGLDDEPASPVTVSVLSAGSVIYEGEIPPARASGGR